MRVLYLHQYFVLPEGSGGTRSYEIARRLVASGHDVIMLTSSARFPEHYGVFTKTTELDINGIHVVVIPVDYSNEMSFRRRIAAFLKFALLSSREAVRHRADVVFATSTPLTIAIPALVAKLWHRIPMVFEVRDLWPELPIAVGALRNPFAKAAAIWLEWIAYHGAAHVVALSPGMAEGVMRRGIPNTRVTVIPNSCDIELFDVPSEHGASIRESLGMDAHQPLIVYAGTFGHINAVEYLIEVAAVTRDLMPATRFLLVGDGVKRGATEALAKERDTLNQNLFIWNSIPKQDIVNVLAAATVATSLFVPLKPMWNNSANKFFDALAAGKPIAINYGGWQADLLNETGAGIVLPPDDPIEGARQLAAFVQDEDRLKAASEAARHLARTRFDRDEMASQLEMILRSVVEK